MYGRVDSLIDKGAQSYYPTSRWPPPTVLFHRLKPVKRNVETPRICVKRPAQPPPGRGADHFATLCSAPNSMASDSLGQCLAA